MFLSANAIATRWGIGDYRTVHATLARAGVERIPWGAAGYQTRYRLSDVEAFECGHPIGQSVLKQLAREFRAVTP